MEYRVLLFDLDGTLLRNDKTISRHTINVLQACREKGVILGISTSRSRRNSMVFLQDLDPEIVISSGGALVHYQNEIVYASKFSVEETSRLITAARTICGESCEITVDTLEEHYWNYRIDPQRLDSTWGESKFSDFQDFRQEALKICVEIHEPDLADKLRKEFPEWDCKRFSDGDWYKFTPKGATKENAIHKICEFCHIEENTIIVFGDDYADIGMLKICGLGIAMGNALPEVKENASEVIGTNEEDGIAEYLIKKFRISTT